MQPERYSQRDRERAMQYVRRIRSEGGNLSFQEALKITGAQPLPAPEKYSRQESPAEAKSRDDREFAKDLARKWREQGRTGVTFEKALAASKRARKAVDQDRLQSRVMDAAMRRLAVGAEKYSRKPPTKQQLTQRIAKAIAGALAEAIRPQTRRWTPSASA